MFKFLSEQERLSSIEKEMTITSAVQKQVDQTNSIVFVTLAENGSIDDVTATEHANLFTPWVSGTTYKIGDMRQYNEELYRCVQAHTSQDDWTPDVTASLWTKVGNPAEEFPAWSQPVGAHDVYNTGDKVTYNEKHWISTVDNNVWQPGVYGWEQVE